MPIPKDNGIRPVKKPGHTRRAKGSFHGQQEQGLSRKLLIHHSDRGIQYCSDILPKEAQACGIPTSMTEKYDPYANVLRNVSMAYQNRNSSRESESRYPKEKNVVTKDARIHIQPKRPHCSCEMLTQCKMHAQM